MFGREFWIGTVYINLVDLLRSEMEAATSNIANHPSGPRGMSFSAGRLSMTMKDMRGSLSLPPSTPTGFSHTAWYVAGSSGVFQKNRGKQDLNDPSLISSTTTNAYEVKDSSNDNKSKKDAKKSDKNKSASTAATTSSLSHVYAMSSRGPREDIENLQIRVTIRALFVHG